MSLLSSGSVIAVVSPSWGGVGVFPQRYELASRWLKRTYNIELVLMENASNKKSHISDTAENRASDLHEAFVSKKYDAVWAATGGDHSISMLPFLDFELIRENPKPFVGYSDNTILCNALSFYSGVQTIYGPSIIGELADQPQPYEFTIDSFEKLFLQDNDSFHIKDSGLSTYEEGDWGNPNDKPRALKAALPWTISNGNSFDGSIFGGCVESIRQFFGTKYQECLTGTVLFLESATHHENMGDIDRDFTHIKNAGIFDNLNGVILGKWRGLDESQQNDANQLVESIIDNSNLPILYNADIGHTDPQMFLPFGWLVKCENGLLTFSHK